MAQRMNPDGTISYFDDFEGGKPPTESALDAADPNMAKEVNAAVADIKSQPVAANGKVAGSDGNVRYDNGKLVGADDPVTTRDANGRPVAVNGTPYEELESTKMMRRMEARSGKLADAERRRKGLKSADEGGPSDNTILGNFANDWNALARQQQAQRAAKSFDIAQQKADENNAVLSTRRQRQVKQNLKVADNIQMATANLGKNLADVQASIKNGGSIAESGAYLSKDGNYYVRGIVAPTMVDAFNKDIAGLGGKDALQKVVVSQQVDKYGNPVGEPTFSALYTKDGISNGKGSGSYAKQLTLSEAMRNVAKAYMDDGQDRSQVASYLAGVFGAENAAKYGYAPTVSEKERIAQMNNDSRERRAQISADATTYKANAAKEIAEMKAKGEDGLDADQLNALSKIVNNPLADEELRSAATQKLLDEINRKRGDGDKGGAAQQKKGGDSSMQGGDEDITLPDGSQGKKHNGKTYRLKGMDKDGNKQWELVK